MRTQLVEGIRWSGGNLSTYAILRDGPLDQDSIVAEPTLYLIEKAKHVESLHSLRATASDLKFYFEALEKAGRDWRDITDNDMSGYIESSLIQGRKLTKVSIIRNASSLGGFYSFTTEFGLTDQHFSFTFSYRNAQHKLIEQGAKRRRTNFKLYKKYIYKSLFEIFLYNANETSGFLRRRDEIVLKLGYYAGLRAFEVTHPENLKVEDIKQKLLQAEKQKNISFSMLIIGKGNKVRHVDFPPELVTEISSFISQERKRVPGENLICAMNGKALSKSFASRLFNRVKKSSLPALMNEIRVLGEMDDPPYTISRSSAEALTFHCLRHTYSTDLVTYCYLHDIDPFTYLPNQLGHNDKETTEIYVNFEASLHNREWLRRKHSEIGAPTS